MTGFSLICHSPRRSEHPPPPPPPAAMPAANAEPLALKLHDVIPAEPGLDAVPLNEGGAGPSPCAVAMPIRRRPADNVGPVVEFHRVDIATVGRCQVWAGRLCRDRF